MLGLMVARLFIVICLTCALMACATTELSSIDMQIPVVCQKYVSATDVEEIRALLANRADIRQPLWGITCDNRGRAIAESGPHRGGDISSFVTLSRRHGKWHIIKIEQGPVVEVTA